MVTYRAILDVPREAVLFLSHLLATERRLRGTRKGTRALTCFHQAVLALRHFRDGTDPATLARDHGIGRSTSYRYIDEATDVLAAQAPDLHHALNNAHDTGVSHLVLDGMVIPTDRCSEKTTSVRGQSIDLWYSGKAHHHGGNVQGVMEPDGFPVFISHVEPGSVNDLPAARAHVLGALYAWAAQGLPNAGRSGIPGCWHRHHHPRQAAE
ncbi:transposase family protein [Nocardiopsis sp. FIRDI 009]|uniref:transposase family protein n=1 Tax=Nocardiopsis sp. FIRDI 009 TaxID=714197 RepID=UPI001E621D84|nr:transposase family protein [Nocardiopsis sp. FIRDI 009]